MFGVLFDCFLAGVCLALFITLACWLVRILATVFGWTTRAVNNTVDEFRRGMGKSNRRREAHS